MKLENIFSLFLSFTVIMSILPFAEEISLCYIHSKDNPLVVECELESKPEDFSSFATSSEVEGWNNFYVESNPNQSNEIQFYSAGYLEGYIYCDNINNHYENIKQTLYQGSMEFSDKVNEFILAQKNFYLTLAKNSSNDYEEMINCISSQIEGLYQGYLKAYKEKENHDFPLIPENEFYYISFLGDLYDLAQAFPRSSKAEKRTNILKFLHKECTGYIKYLPEKNDIIIAHNTHNIYSMMNRIYKHYNIKVTTRKTGRKISEVKFTSRPGDLNSKDDFYYTSNKMVILETSLEVYNKELYHNLSPNTVPKFMRAQIANFLSQNNEEWINNFLNYNSGTHNNQWFIVDYKILEQQDKQKLVFILEQTPNIKVRYYKDVTDILLKEGYLGAYNAAYFPEVIQELGYKEKQDYYHAYRYSVIKQLNTITETIEETKYLISYHDSNSLCDQIGARCDIEGTNPFGCIDGKVINKEMLEKMKAVIRYGPPYIPGLTLPFKFTVPKYENFTRYGICDEFDFDWVEL